MESYRLLRYIRPSPSVCNERLAQTYERGRDVTVRKTGWEAEYGKSGSRSPTYIR